MSGGSGGGAVACVEQAIEFINPPSANSDFSTIFESNTTVQLSWNGDRSTEPRTNEINLYLESFNTTTVNQSIAAFTISYGSAFVTQSWTFIDSCGDTAMNHSWLVPSDLDPSVRAWKIVARNETQPNALGTLIASSPAFLIKQQASSSSIVSTTATGTPSSSTQDASPTSTTSTVASATASPSPGLSAGAKAGIGIGCAAAAIFILGAVLLWYRRRKPQRQSPGQTVAAYEKPELDGQFIPSQFRAELGDGEARKPRYVELEAHERPVQLAGD